ncbi:dolichol phosphate-mannose biosynthesis regulatory protein-related protein [Prunus dulcis]|uniref:Dolichol phosphate-mannose biosynthesis regulatory protein-related protein n=1 Tax=Prunus dulcis TaxID=3755 RepID=A0A4Y1RFI1_PRUDU|nr:dolichol phosphate-mannose biosynthesis regulatory protein-related protein [Prunus dulcis]
MHFLGDALYDFGQYGSKDCIFEPDAKNLMVAEATDITMELADKAVGKLGSTKSYTLVSS